MFIPDPEWFFSDPDPDQDTTFKDVSAPTPDQDPVSDPSHFIPVITRYDIPYTVNFCLEYKLIFLYFKAF
jgi:hypothetical protein